MPYWVLHLADRVHYIRPAVESFGGPDNWAASNAMAALVEGLAGVKNDGLAFDSVTLSPRWTSAGMDSVNVTIQFAASKGYVAYRFKHDATKKEIEIMVTGSGNSIQNHILLPKDCKAVGSVKANGIPVDFSLSKIENSVYADFSFSLPMIQDVRIIYK